MSNENIQPNEDVAYQAAAAFYEIARNSADKLVEDIADKEAREFVHSHLMEGLYAALLGIEMDTQCQALGAKRGEYKIKYQEPIIC